VQTKFSKTFTSYFFPVGNEIHEIVSEWMAYLLDEKLWGNDDPLFPATRIEVGKASRQFEAAGLDRVHWNTTTPIGNIFKNAFTTAGLPSTRTVSEIPLPSSVNRSARPRKNLRHGARTSGMRRF